MSIFTLFFKQTESDTKMSVDRSLKWDTELITDAIAHYCHICKIGLKTRGGKKNHMRLKHHE